MSLPKFSEWVAMQEQQAVAPTAPANAPKTPAGGNKSPVDAEINQVIIANMGKPKQARKTALVGLAKKKQGTATPEDLKRIADAASGSDK
jgi:hypothetical protein